MNNTETSRELARKIFVIEQQVNPLLANLNLLRLQHRDALSRELITGLEPRYWRWKKAAY
jgi:hypothetical protein